MNFVLAKVTQRAEGQTSHSKCLHRLVDGSQIQSHQSQVSFCMVPWPMDVFVQTPQDVGTFGSWGALFTPISNLTPAQDDETTFNLSSGA